MSKLSPEHKTFASAIVDQPTSGLSDGQCYRDANKRCNSDQAAAVGAHKWLKKANIQQEISRLQGKTETKETYSRQRKRERLHEIGEGDVDDTKVSDMNKAIQIDNKMTGDDQPIRTDGELTIGNIMKSLSSSTGLARRKVAS